MAAICKDNAICPQQQKKPVGQLGVVRQFSNFGTVWPVGAGEYEGS